MKVLVTGGAGFIGSHVVEHFQDKAEVRVLDNFSTGHPDNLEGLQCEVINNSVLNRFAVRRAMEGVDFVFHLAGLSSVEESMKKPIEYAETNSLGTLIVVEEAALAGITKLVYASSAAVYGDEAEPCKERGRLEPKSPYAATKLAGEVYCQIFTIDKKLPTVSVRCFNVFGPRQRGNTGVVPTFLYRAMKNAALKINGDGRQTRDFIYVKSVVAAMVFLGLHPEATGTFNVGSGTATSIRELASRIIDITGSRSEIHPGPDRPGDIRHSIAAIERLLAAGFTPSTNFDHELRMTAAWFRSIQHEI